MQIGLKPLKENSVQELYPFYLEMCVLTKRTKLKKGERETLLAECHSIRNCSSNFLRKLILSDNKTKEMQNIKARNLKRYLPESVFGGILENNLKCENCDKV
ncbi:hypothetical protein MHBO_000681 [Bonamia ostreae]|uniref:Uncharacterized protein n=1 Tax=Bonamia ostreae TaxID=126728 RepID=A0ABV2AGF7_9EUKA